MKPSLRWLGILTVSLLLPSTASALPGIFGYSQSVHKIAGTGLRDAKGQSLFLGYRVSKYFIFAGIFAKDEGYVLGSDSSHYYELPASQLASYQAKRLLPNPLPSYGIGWFDLLTGFSLWIIIAAAVVYHWVRIGLKLEDNPVSTVPLTLFPSRDVDKL